MDIGSPNNDSPNNGPQNDGENHGVLVIGPDGQPIDPAAPRSALTQDPEGLDPTDAIGEPAKVMRIGTMIKQLLEEVRAAPLDEASRVRLMRTHALSILELKSGLTPDLAAELDRLALPFSDDAVPTDSELRIAQAQLVGWLEGVFHGLQTALFAQQGAARMQLEQARRPALPAGQGSSDVEAGSSLGTGQYL
ncbi:bacterial proteasome activator family protein [Nakamurella antarctica]|uniref:Bacterial proteasome activator n=1 Tax=Nakamurella antarctica TaxID=1902245 RepID=A0A3G8ZZ78_9ACTN|nr:bacterial proteasome activator family protein [Nakamurella antarctica]